MGGRSAQLPGVGIALAPLIVVMTANLTLSRVVLPRRDTPFLEEALWGAKSITAVGGVWSVIVALAAAIVVFYACNRSRLASLRHTVEAGLDAAALPVVSVAADEWTRPADRARDRRG